MLEGLHAGAPDLFPGTGLPGEASGFEEAFSAVRHAFFTLDLGLSFYVHAGEERAGACCQGQLGIPCLPSRPAASCQETLWRHSM